VFAVHNVRSETIDDYLCVISRERVIDQDTIGIVTQNDGKYEKIFVVVDSETDRDRDYILNSIETREIEYVEMGTRAFVTAMAKSGTVIMKDRLWQFWLLSTDSTQFIKIPHGISAKDVIPSKKKGCTMLGAVKKRLGIADNYSMTVASQIEYHRKAGVLGMNKDHLCIYGYPRYDRARDLAAGRTDAILPDETRATFEESETTKVLYAPTHKDGAFETTLFPFPDFDRDRLIEFLAENDIQLYLRMHVYEEGKGIPDEYLDGEHILYSGNDFANSGVEMMPYFDALITDYSSIYLDFVLFDKPMLFVKDDIEQYRKVRGFAFDYDTYWPGPKVETQEQFIDALTAVTESGKDEFGYERRFVRDTFHPEQGEQFLSNVAEARRH